MANTETEASPWESKFGGGHIHNAQYLAECMCDRIAKKDGRELGHKFWEIDEWKRAFCLQIRQANALLKLYSCTAIIRGLKTPQGKKVYSLGAKWLEPIIKDEQKKIDTQARLRKEFASEAPQVAAPSDVTPEPPRPTFSAKQSLFTKLRNLDG